jgi:hypothetical protein
VGVKYNPGWNLTTDLPSMLTVSRCTTSGPQPQGEPGRPHPGRLPEAVAEMGKVNFVQRIADPGHRRRRGTPSIRSITATPEPIPVMPDDLKALFEEALMAEET